MTEILKTIELIEDKRQEKKVRHKLLDIVVIVLFAKLAKLMPLPSFLISLHLPCPYFLGHRKVCSFYSERHMVQKRMIT